MFEILATPSGYSYKPTIYKDKFTIYGEIYSDWSWQTEKSKRFIALNADKIYNRVYDMICERFAEETKRKIASVRKQSEQLINDIAQLEN